MPKVEWHTAADRLFPGDQIWRVNEVSLLVLIFNDGILACKPMANYTVAN